MKSDHKSKLITALKKASGSLQKVQQMIEADAYCIDVMQQVNAVIGLLRNANNRILKNHLETCGHTKMSAKNKKVRDDFVLELMKALDISSRK